eukprot:3092070-Rhodomonas_salina.1
MKESERGQSERKSIRADEKERAGRARASESILADEKDDGKGAFGYDTRRCESDDERCEPVHSDLR